MARPMKKLRVKMIEEDVTKEECIKAIKRSSTYWTERIMGRKYFELSDIYILCEILHIPLTDIAVYFPPLKAVS